MLQNVGFWGDDLVNTLHHGWREFWVSEHSNASEWMILVGFIQRSFQKPYGYLLTGTNWEKGNNKYNVGNVGITLGDWTSIDHQQIKWSHEPIASYHPHLNLGWFRNSQQINVLLSRTAGALKIFYFKISTQLLCSQNTIDHVVDTDTRILSEYYDCSYWLIIMKPRIPKRK